VKVIKQVSYVPESRSVSRDSSNGYAAQYAEERRKTGTDMYSGEEYEEYEEYEEEEIVDVKGRPANSVHTAAGSSKLVEEHEDEGEYEYYDEEEEEEEEGKGEKEGKGVKSQPLSMKDLQSAPKDVKRSKGYAGRQQGGHRNAVGTVARRGAKMAVIDIKNAVSAVANPLDDLYGLTSFRSIDRRSSISENQPISRSFLLKAYEETCSHVPAKKSSAEPQSMQQYTSKMIKQQRMRARMMGKRVRGKNNRL
ncbi:hypothetical protein ADUPG1_010652, partial [Aduncisulcus paluster]